ncbi:MAG: HD domain-containing protein [Chlamydiia bacterium]|nr:HD domain-containing protein [Chlamydiia bacterium]
MHVLAQYRAKVEEREAAVLSPYAELSSAHSRPFGAEDDHRLPYKRDVDRIVHSKAYARYVDKTQVVYLVDNDHVTHRSLHVQLVSNFARGIAEILGLNVDLVEAIALGHDVGHPPFGHEGEQYLCELSRDFGEGSFAHPWQSCRLYREIEPLNLGLAVYDGFLCHDGGMRDRVIRPKHGKTWELHYAELDKKHRTPGVNLAPATLEGCLVKLCDTMSYLMRDVEDAISLGVLTRDRVPETRLGRTNREFLARIAADIIRSSYGRDEIGVSEEVFADLKVLRTFNFKEIYQDPRIKVESGKIRRSYRILFETLLKDFEHRVEDSYIWGHFAHNKPKRYLDAVSPARMVIDFISGMTDGYFVKTLERLIVPQRIDLR